ncbi:hypothetical protein TVAGG3_0615660 [Trichomonas vaginalis G3]|uniref:hypothetical protein n=1 Tax=Trichomonas vaginalis (strain ATCC PRA-98 / G3) TaxID=412133 RepID=UPI0021E55B7F|nr:hypothetical protein TVAGG3_0615660 [Trichomonas vaginalis G3]KAI5503530.1 hypothetical protein TVAGG3_0615660 [Trichomonas vaginalis G3]
MQQGCFDDVYENNRRVFLRSIRDSVEFPRLRTIGCTSSTQMKRYTMVELNAAYMRFVQYIPTGIPKRRCGVPGRKKSIQLESHYNN